MSNTSPPVYFMVKINIKDPEALTHHYGQFFCPTMEKFGGK